MKSCYKLKACWPVLAIATIAFESSALGQNLPDQTSTPPASNQSWVVRDPVTGKLYQQRLVNVTVPVTRMEAKTIDQPVYELRTESGVQQVPETVYQASTQYVMQPKLRGWWNPMRQPTQAYEYVPITSWQPQTQMVPQARLTQRWVAKSQKVVVYQPVQTTETRQQLVQTELPQPAVGAASLTPTVVASQTVRPNSSALPVIGTFPRQPLISIPLLAQQRVLPWPPLNSPIASTSFPKLRPILSNPLAIANSQSIYHAPLQNAATLADVSHRDSLQAGMQPTVLR